MPPQYPKFKQITAPSIGEGLVHHRSAKPPDYLSFLWLCRPASACCSRLPPRVPDDLPQSELADFDQLRDDDELQALDVLPPDCLLPPELF